MSYASAPTFPPYPDGPYSPGFFVGGQDGNPFLACGGTDGRVVTTIGFWADNGGGKGTYLYGMKVIFSDGSETMAGGVKEDYTEITFAPNERVTALTLWGNGDGKYTGRIQLKTNLGQTLDWGKNTNGQTAYSAPVNSGILVGVAGRQSTNTINMLSLVFLDDVISVTMQDVVYPTTPSAPITPVAVAQATYDQENSPGLNFDFSGSVTRTETQDWSEATSQQYGVGLSVTAGIFGIAEVTTNFSWQLTDTQTYSQSTNQQYVMNYGLSGSFTDDQTVTATATCQYGVADVPYTATITVTMASGFQFTYDTSGIFSNVVYAYIKANATYTEDTAEESFALR
ncbi:hypothetical protein GCM10022223_32580 [Kineosporia mesophila]|uniref:Jacalin-type lectin domain-containing protein n=1 Tax=Kineosporia mesophila TaxID=566012 RepID=A0ABP6ZPX8_9ACTN|nr:hypothetical protein [Kineosporia mesophila]MCD5353743.1 hypothetical protein [Kineosporia mesophila]